MNSVHIKAVSIADAWFQLIYNIFDNSYKQPIQRGSFEGEEYRIQYPFVSIEITHPETDIVPCIPSHLGIPSPTTMEYINDYFEQYLMSSRVSENEEYTYGQRIHSTVDYEITPQGLAEISQFNKLLHILEDTPFTNQAVLEIAEPTDIVLDSPPCLRTLDWKVIPVGEEKVLTVTAYFRSWDLWAGLPSNLGGIELLKQLVASECNLSNGPMYACSAGLHLYGYQEELAKLRVHREESN